MRAAALDSTIALAVFAVVAALSELLGAANLGTALGFGQIAFGAAVVGLIALRD